jgi:hypothetical protein
VRYSKAALLIFGAGLMVGLLAVVGEVAWLGRAASGLMVLGIVVLPIAVVADVRHRLSAPRASAHVRRSRRHGRRTRPRRSAGPRR